MLLEEKLILGSKKTYLVRLIALNELYMVRVFVKDVLGNIKIKIDGENEVFDTLGYRKDPCCLTKDILNAYVYYNKMITLLSK